jgi:transketolase
VVRPADGPETAAAWTLAIERRKGPTALVLTRQETAVLERAANFDTSLMMRGGYVLSDAAGPGAGGSGAAKSLAPLVLIASGSEVGAAVEAQRLLVASGLPCRVVSMASPQIFLTQSAEYRESVIPKGARSVVIEAAVLQGWERVAGNDALFLGIDRFGASAPWKVLQEKFGFTGAQIADKVKARFG